MAPYDGEIMQVSQKQCYKNPAREPPDTAAGSHHISVCRPPITARVHKHSLLKLLPRCQEPTLLGLKNICAKSPPC